MRDEISNFLRLGALVPFNPAMGSPTIHPLSVAVKQPSGKKRLCIDANLTNIFEPYTPTQFELLKDVLPLLLPGDLASTSDLTKGYLHVPLHPDSRHFLCIQFDSRTYAFSALPFGLSSAVAVFQSIMQAIYLPLRARGWRLSFMIDDCIMLWRSAADSWLASSIFARILCALGAHFSLNKCSFGPNSLVRYQGMLIDLHSCSISIPEEKVNLFCSLTKELCSTPTTTARQLARLAGILVSFHVALPLGQLLTHELFSAIANPSPSWDSPICMSLNTKLFLSWLGTFVPQHNGKRFWKRNATVILVSDASAHSAGGAVFSASHPHIHTPLQAPLPDPLLSSSSGTRELAAIDSLVDCILEHPEWKEELVHGSLKILTDSQVAAFSIANMSHDPRL